MQLQRSRRSQWAQSWGLTHTWLKKVGRRAPLQATCRQCIAWQTNRHPNKALERTDLKAWCTTNNCQWHLAPAIKPCQRFKARISWRVPPGTRSRRNATSKAPRKTSIEIKVASSDKWPKSISKVRRGIESWSKSNKLKQKSRSFLPCKSDESA